MEDHKSVCLEKIQKKDINLPIKGLKKNMDKSKYDFDLITLNGDD